MKICVLGSGYVGLVTAVGLAEIGNHVLCVDIDESRVEALRAGKVPFFEPGLHELMVRNARGGRITFATQIEPAYRDSEIYFIAVGTPPSPSGRADLSAVFAATETIGRMAVAPAVLAVKSTVPVGTGDEVERRLRAVAGDRLSVVSNPEFLKEGTALDDFFRPDRVLIGAEDADAARKLEELYRPLQLASERTLIIDRRSSELSKYAANAMLAARISFMNELARLCDRIGADITAVRHAIGSDHRIGRQFLFAGPGFGGSCFPKDVSALAMLSADAGVELAVVNASGEANIRQRQYVIERLRGFFPDGFAGKRIAVWGLAFKPETDDVRESPAAPLVRHVLDAGGEVHAHDAEAAANFAKAFAPEAKYFEREYDALDGADALVLMTEWRHFRNPDFDEIRRRMRTPNILDARNIWQTAGLREKGFRYFGIGTIAGREGGATRS
jgi:UDPglucose 6-dehydrogenase